MYCWTGFVSPPAPIGPLLQFSPPFCAKRWTGLFPPTARFRHMFLFAILLREHVGRYYLTLLRSLKKSLLPYYTLDGRCFFYATAGFGHSLLF